MDGLDRGGERKGRMERERVGGEGKEKNGKENLLQQFWGYRRSK